MVRKRRGRREGSIFERADGQWVGSISLGYDGSGKRKRRVVYGKSKTEVQEKLRGLQTGVDRGVDVSANRTTLQQWLTRWLVLVKPKVEPGTYNPYKRHCDKHIIPLLGHVQLTKLKRFHIQGFYPALADLGVSPAMQRKIGTTLTIALNEAVRLDLLPSNPALGVKKPKAQKPEIHPLDPQQVGSLLEAAEEDRLYPFYLTALDSGARPGELFALTWPDVDFPGGFISISKSLEDIDGILRVKTVKTPKGRRRIELSTDTMAVLAEHRKAMFAAGFIDGPVFCDTEGGYLRLSNLHRTSLKPLLTKAGLPGVSLYALRHTCATLLLLANESAKVVSERLGHSSITLTLDTYSHVLPTMQRRAADVMGRILSAARAAN
jgi:integrase